MAEPPASNSLFFFSSSKNPFFIFIFIKITRYFLFELMTWNASSLSFTWYFCYCRMNSLQLQLTVQSRQAKRMGEEVSKLGPSARGSFILHSKTHCICLNLSFLFLFFLIYWLWRLVWAVQRRGKLNRSSLFFLTETVERWTRDPIGADDHDPDGILSIFVSFSWKTKGEFDPWTYLDDPCNYFVIAAHGYFTPISR
jgi:hypothetical protein